jgi:hypothetical protein
MSERGSRVRVYLVITKDGYPLKGAGAWGEGTTEKDARAAAKKHLREGFGRLGKDDVRERVEWIRREVARHGPLSVTTENLEGDVFLDFWHDDQEESLYTVRLEMDGGVPRIRCMDPEEGGVSSVVFDGDDL